MMALYPHFLRSIALPSVSVFTESRFWSLYRGLSGPNDENAFSPSTGAVNQKVRDLIAHAYENVAFYRDRMESAGLKPESFQDVSDLSKLPPTTKKDVNANFPDQISDASESRKPWRYTSTSGTIERTSVIHDFRKRDVVRATQILAANSATAYQPGLKYMEIPPDVCRNVCGAAGAIEPGILQYFWDNLKSRRLTEPEVVSDLRGMAERQLIYRQLVLPSFGHHGVDQSKESFHAYLKSIKDYRPYILKALPIYLYALALHIQDEQLSPPPIPGGLMPMGSSMSPYLKRVIESAFQCRVHEDYGCAELGAIGAECGRQSGIHPFASLFHVEVLHNGRPAKPGELGKVLITDLFSYAMPFIRYEIGDVALVLDGECGCGRKGLRFDVQGRMQDCLPGANGTLLTSDAITDAILPCPGVRVFQLVMEHEDEIDLQIAARPGMSPDLGEIRQKLCELFGRPMRISCRTVPTIMPEAGGKFRLVKSSIRRAVSRS